MNQKTYSVTISFSIVIFSFLKKGLVFSLFVLPSGRGLFYVTLTKQMGTLGMFFLNPILLYDRTPYLSMINELFETLKDINTENYINKNLDQNTPIDDDV